jgi:hypothetical protein
MWPRLLLITAPAAGVPLGGVAQSQNFGGSTERFFHVEWRVDQDGGHPAIVGHVYNDWNTRVNSILLEIAELNAAGQELGTSFVSLNDEISGGARAFFEAPVRSVNATYRVTVRSFEWIRRGHGR